MNLLTKTTFMIKTIYFMFFICMFAVAMVACKEDEYVYPNVITTFIDAATD